MPSKQQGPAASISPVLFLNEDGEPMSFFLHPGPIKRKLQPLISAGGGILCRTQQPGAILLIAPEDGRFVPESAAHRYVSTQFIHESIEKGEQLNIEDFKLDPEVAQKQNPGLNKSKDSSAKASPGRMTFTPEEDAAIFHYVSKRMKMTGGNRLWLEMEEKRVTNHSWQSMKDRHKRLLKRRQSKDLEVKATEDDDETAKMESNQECDADKSSCEAEIARPPSADSDLTQIDVQATAAGCTLENQDPQAAVTAQVEERQDQEVDKQPCVEATSPTTQTENSDQQLRTAEGSESERDEPQTKTLQNLHLHKDSPAAQPKATPKSTSKSPRDKMEASLRLEQPQRRVSRRRLGLEALSSSSSSSSSSPEPYAKKLRSSTRSTEQATSSPQLSKKIKLTRKSAPRNISKDQAQNGTRWGRAGAENRLEQSGSDSEAEPDQRGTHSDGRLEKSVPDSKLAQTDEMNSAPQKGGKRKEKRTQGILELARNEFEDDNESEDPDRPETATTSAELLHQPRDTPAGPTPARSHADTRTHLQDDGREGRVSGDDCESNSGPSVAAPAEKNCSDAVGASSKAHLFIFDSESQEDDSQFVGEASAAQPKPQPTGIKDAPFSLTQVQLEEDKRRIRDLIAQTNQDLVSVTKALLKVSGDFSAALDLLLNPSSVSALIWDPHDDHLLLSANPDVRQRLLEKYDLLQGFHRGLQLLSFGQLLLPSATHKGGSVSTGSSSPKTSHMGSWSFRGMILPSPITRLS
uniref:Telomeric repeat-binding factor 2-interacting protein 1 n=3 Tax=Nothobranchius furzeri TaxID=105023 RepID=A0A8C6VW34_NOTFU